MIDEKRGRNENLGDERKPNAYGNPLARGVGEAEQRRGKTEN